MSPLLGVEPVCSTPYVVTWCSTRLFVWNLISCSVNWTHDLPIRSICVDPFNPRFAVISTDSQTPRLHTRISVFGPESSTAQSAFPVAVDVRAACFLRGDLRFSTEVNPSSLVVLSKDNELVVLSLAEEAEETSASDTAHDISSGFRQMFGGFNINEAMSSTPSAAPNVQPAFQRAIAVMDYPSHALPSVSKLYDTFVGLLLQPSQLKTEPVQVTPEKQAQDVEMSFRADESPSVNSELDSIDFTAMVEYFKSSTFLEGPGAISSAPVCGK